MNVNLKKPVLFKDIWVKDCFHMSFLPAVQTILGNADCVLFNQIFKYEKTENCLNFKPYDFQDIYTILKQQNINAIPAKQVEDICIYLKEQLQADNMIIVGVDNYYETVRRDCYHIKHNGHSVLVYGMDTDYEVFHIVEQPFFYSTQYTYYDMPFDSMKECYDSYVKHIDQEEFFYNKLTDTTLIHGRNPSVCSVGAAVQQKKSQDVNLRKFYIKRLKAEKQEIVDSLTSILAFADEFGGTYHECNKESPFSLNIIKNLNDLINNKGLEIYLLKKTGIVSEELEQISSKIVKEWMELRMMLSKYMFSKNFNERHMLRGKEILKDIYELEYHFYQGVI